MPRPLLKPGERKKKTFDSTAAKQATRVPFNDELKMTWKYLYSPILAKHMFLILKQDLGF